MNELMKYSDRDQHIYYGSGINPTVMKMKIRYLSSANFVALDCSCLDLEHISNISKENDHLIPTTFESLIMEAIRTYKDNEFKILLALAKDRPPPGSCSKI